MKTAGVAELKNRLSHYLRLVARGETVTVLERGKPVAQITPLDAVEDELAQLAAEGTVRLPLRSLPRDFWRKPLPRSKAPTSDAVIEDREDRVR